MTEGPGGLSDTPYLGGAMDVLSDVLRVVRLSGAVFSTARMTSPWSVETPPPDELARLLVPRARRLALFHLVVEGECQLSIPGITAFTLRAGEAVVLPRGDVHIMSSRAGLCPVPLMSLLSPSATTDLPHLERPGNGRTTRVVCGYLHFDHQFNPLIGALPPVLHVRRVGDSVRVEAPADDADHADHVAHADHAVPTLAEGEASWLESTLRLTVDEARSPRPGSAAMLSRLTEILFVEVFRAYVERMPPTLTGWLAGVHDEEVGRALRLLHAYPQRKWTVADLAGEVGRSRSSLAARFAAYTGMPPMRYLAEWRMQLAKHLLQRPDLSVAAVGARVGYDAEAAFSRAFKREVGLPPAAWRAGNG